MKFDKISEIKNKISMSDILNKYSFKKSRTNFICCPFHNEKTPSMKIYEQDFHCFGCGEHGDTISFVQKLFGLSFPDTLKKIDLDFNLNLYGEHSFEDLRKSHYRQKQIQAERERKEREKEQFEKEYWSAFDEWKRLEDNKRKYAPKTPDEEWHTLFVEALQKLAYQEYLLDIAEMRRC